MRTELIEEIIEMQLTLVSESIEFVKNRTLNDEEKGLLLIAAKRDNAALLSKTILSGRFEEISVQEYAIMKKVSLLTLKEHIAYRNAMMEPIQKSSAVLAEAISQLLTSSIGEFF